MTRSRFIILAGLWLALPGMAAAQNNAAPANVVTPAPAPREGTVGPEQLRDFALPGTERTATPPAAAEPLRPRPAEPAPAPSASPPAATSDRPATPVRSDPPASEPAAAVARQEGPASAAPPTTSTSTAAEPFSLPTAGDAFTPAPLPPPSQPLPPITVTQSGTQASSLLPGWWPWMLVAVLAGVGLALVLRQRRRFAAAGHDSGGVFERVASPPRPAAPAPPPVSAPAPLAEPPAAPPLPTGLVTTRLRQPAPPPAAPSPAPTAPAPAPAPVVGGIVSRRLRGWVDIDLHVREILFDANEAVLRVDLVISNNGTAPARQIALEALTINGSEEQGAEIARFFARPAASTAAIPELGPLSDVVIGHEVRMPRAAIRAYEAQGKALFVPIVAISAAYQVASGEGRTGAAFLVGRDLPGSERLAPLLLPPDAGRQLGLGVRRLEEAIRR
nr:hypothetical protein [uncultured Sphingomonas sp.]